MTGPGVGGWAASAPVGCRGLFLLPLLVVLAGGAPQLKAAEGTGMAAEEACSVPEPGASQAVLEEEALRFAQAWVDQDVPGITALLAEEGIRLHLEGDLYPSVGSRRAAAALQAFLAKYPGGEIELTRTSRNAGDDPTGFAELRWRTTIAGRDDGVIFTLFVAFSRRDAGWVVTEIRVLS